MTPERYRERVAEIEARANARVDEAIAAFPIAFPARRAVRYRDIGRAIAFAAIQPKVAQIEREMRDELDALEREWWSTQEG